MPRGGGWLRAGRVGAPHGLDGSFHVLEPRPELLAAGEMLRVGDDELPVVRRAGTDRRPILRLQGRSDRAAAEALRGRELLAARARAPRLGPDEWWIEDLEGCRVRDGERELGAVQRVLALPSCEVLEVVGPGVDGELLVPLVGDAVRTVDIERRIIDIDLIFLGER